METKQMTPFFSSTFSALFVIFIFVFENSQNSFSYGLHFGPFWSVKYLRFWEKATNSDSSQCFSRKQTQSTFPVWLWGIFSIPSTYMSFIFLVESLLVWRTVLFQSFFQTCAKINYPVHIYLFKVNNRNTRKKCEVNNKNTRMTSFWCFYC